MFALLIALSLLFSFVNGFHNSSNIVATVISSRALRPRLALLLAAAAEFAGPFILGIAVARTLGADLLDASIITPSVVNSALIAALAWNFLTWYFGIPSSSSHALLGGLLGAGLTVGGITVVKSRGLTTTLVSLLISPLLGLVVGFLIMRFTLWATRNATPKVNTLFRRLQLVTLVGLGLSQGSNDGQKTMGVLTLGLLTAGYITEFAVPLWVVALSAGSIALGTSTGGWRLIRTLGGKMYRIRPVHGITSQVAGASVILAGALLGGPVSATHVLSSSIMGVGAAERISQVRWTILQDLALAWALTIPATAALAGIAASILPRLPLP